MKKLTVLVILLLGLIPCTAEADVINNISKMNMSIGENLFFDCSENCDISYNLTCWGMCGDPCYSHVSLDPNQTYELVEGNCDLRFDCVGQPLPATVDFPGTINMVKENTTLELNIDIEDWLGRSYLNKTWGFDYEEFEVIKSPFKFECPAEIKTDINLENCLPYLSSAFNESDSLTYQMSYLNQMCFEDLNDCHSREMLNDKIADDCEAKYSRAFSDYENEYRKYEDCVLQLDETNENTKVGSYKAEVDSFNEQIRRGQLVPRKDHDSVVIMAWILGIILTIVLILAFFGGGSEL